jgi:hypothetical protein
MRLIQRREIGDRRTVSIQRFDERATTFLGRIENDEFPARVIISSTAGKRSWWGSERTWRSTNAVKEHG